MNKYSTLKAAVFGGFLAVGATALVLPADVFADGHLPGEGKSVKLARASWDTGWFQAEIYSLALQELGYDVEGPTTLDNPAFYQAVGQGDLDLWVNGWFPLHNTYEDNFQPGATKIGYVAKGGALQGYLIDKKTAEAHNISSVEDFKKDEIKKLFDSNGDGKAEMVACPPGWGCEKVIEHHMEAYGLTDHVEPIKAAYSASMADAVGKYENGEPIFFYTWTPNWTVGILKPGEDVVWLEVAEANLPEDQKNLEDGTTFPGVVGCANDPCKLGWPVSDIRPVANVEFLEENPAVKTLLEVMEIPIEDIFEQNAKMQAGEDKKRDLERHAAEWIAANQATVDGWLAQAKAAAK